MKNKDEKKCVYLGGWKFNLFEIYKIEDTKISSTKTDDNFENEYQKSGNKKIILHNGREIKLSKKESDILEKLLEILGLPTLYV